MATIEERAKEYADNFIVGDAAIIVDLVHDVVVESYIDSATEQQKIDIDKACKWLKGHASSFGYAESDGLDAVYNYDSDMLVRMFTKAMKGE